MFERHPADRRNALADGSMTWEEEVDFYIREIGRDFSKDAATLVPILDSFNHHRKSNVLWGQNNGTQAFYLIAGDEIPAGAEVMDSYGSQADSILFSTYGFNNGDGSGVTLAKLAPYHHMYDEDLFTDETGLLASKKLREKQRKRLLKYFEYDDGYSRCLQGPADDPERIELTSLKLDWLEKMANNPQLWSVSLEARNPNGTLQDTTGGTKTMVPPEFDIETIQFLKSLGGVLSLCRVISITHRDYEGNATAILRDGVNLKAPILMKPGNDGLELRSRMCIARLANTALEQFDNNVIQQTDLVAQLNKEAYFSPEWNAAHVRLGEMQSLQAIGKLAFWHVQKQVDKIENPPSDDFIIRFEECPAENYAFLLERKS
jgi:hypothetical protein